MIITYIYTTRWLLNGNTRDTVLRLEIQIFIVI